MRKIVVTELLSLDGVAEAPDSFLRGRGVAEMPRRAKCRGEHWSARRPVKPCGAGSIEYGCCRISCSRPATSRTGLTDLPANGLKELLSQRARQCGRPRVSQ